MEKGSNKWTAWLDDCFISLYNLLKDHAVIHAPSTIISDNCLFFSNKIKTTDRVSQPDS